MRASPGLAFVCALAAAEPAAPAPDARAARPTPFTSSRAGEVVVGVTVGGRGPYRFLLDTGSTHTAVTVRLADEVAAAPVARTTMRAAGGTIDCVVVALPALVVGAVAAEGILATALPASARTALGDTIDGILGQDFLARFAYTIDYRRGRIVWHDADYVGPGIVLALTPADGRFLVDLPHAATPGRPAMRRFVPDSGADTIVLFGEARAREIVSEWRPATTLDSLTGARTVRTAIVNGLRIGPSTLDGLPAAVVGGGSHPRDDAVEPDGLLPLHVFAAVSFNAQRGVVAIQLP